ncbi:hypothetical protein [Nocardioides sp. AX2bis]|uniref:hypothetical protein n=1 Tax=Nocardioides sp. AX2bis TaxID=2653157 RepID=UPI0012F393F1|nr:hypothetical protein [Nocardioides sp. AX2bis]VXB15236.1 conserved membrane hypothetical protein [Nocardioides sp. AX2bis]
MTTAAEPTSETTGPARPRALTWVSRGVWAQVVVGVLTAALVVVERGALMDAWTAGQPPDSTIAPLSFVPVALVCCGTFVGSALLMLAFLRAGHGWARWCLAAIVAFVVLATVAALRTAPPAPFLVVSVVGLVVEVATLVELWRPSVSRFLRGVAASERPVATS